MRKLVAKKISLQRCPSQGRFTPSLVIDKNSWHVITWLSMRYNDTKHFETINQYDNPFFNTSHNVIMYNRIKNVHIMTVGDWCQLFRLHL